MYIMLKVIDRFNTIPIKIPSQFHQESEIAILNFISNEIIAQDSKNFLNNKIIFGGITILNLKQYYRAIVKKICIVLVE